MTDTNAIIDEALKEDQARKEAKRRAKEGLPVQVRGKTLEEIEDEEGGPVKESMAGMAHVKRAKKRKGSYPGEDVELPANIEAAEEDEDVEEEDGVKFTAFNLREERQHGYFDEEGNFVEHKGDEDEDKDAWFAADGVAIVSADVKKKIEERQKMQAQEDSARPLTGRELAALKAKIVAVMRERETIPATLKRLGGNKGKQGMLKGGRTKVSKQNLTAEELQAREVIDMITEAASTLMIQGETDIYDETKEELQRAVALYAPREEQHAADDGDDMFASDDENTTAMGTTAMAAATNGHSAPDTTFEAVGTAGQGAPPAAEASGTAPHTAAPQPAEEDVDYASWPIRELRRFLEERGQDAGGIVEKGDLVDKVKQVAAAGPEGDLPAGFTFDPTSGYYYSSHQQLYYDAASGLYYSGNDGQWYSIDTASGAYTPVGT